MAIVKWSRPFPSMWSSMLDDDNWPTVSWPDLSSSSGLDIYETDTDVVVEAQVPGIPEKNVEVTIEGNVLTINASFKEEESEKNKKKTIYKATRQSVFNYSTNLPRTVDSTKAKAEVENGVVKICVPKVEAEKPQRIEVKKK